MGRVDRFFSRIERRLSTEGAPPDVALQVGYPHVVSSLERGQVERLITRQRRVERLLDSSLAGTAKEAREFVVGAQAPRAEHTALQPSRPHGFPADGRNVVARPALAARATARQYETWYATLAGALREAGWRIAPADPAPVRAATLFGEGRQLELGWSFDAALERYVVTVSGTRAGEEMSGGGSRQRLAGRTRRIETFTRLLVPTPVEGQDEDAVAHLVQAQAGASPPAPADGRLFWDEALGAVASGGVDWVSAHQAQVVVGLGARAHRITLSAYGGGVRLVGVVAALADLRFRSGWGGEPNLDRVRDWALHATNDLPLGYLDVHPSDGLVFGIHALHGALSAHARRRLVEEVAWRADARETSLTGDDRW